MLEIYILSMRPVCDEHTGEGPSQRRSSPTSCSIFLSVPCPAYFHTRETANAGHVGESPAMLRGTVGSDSPLFRRIYRSLHHLRVPQIGSVRPVLVRDRCIKFERVILALGVSTILKF